MRLSNWKEESHLVFDVETTGLSPENGHKIIEIAFVAMQRGEVVEHFVTRANPGRSIPQEATSVNGIRDEDVSHLPAIQEWDETFSEVLADINVVVAYNAPFDMKYVRSELPLTWAQMSRKAILDPLVAVRLDHIGRYWKGPGRHRLQSVVERLRLVRDDDDVNWHGSLTDSIMTGRVLWTLRDELPDDLDECLALLSGGREEQQRQYEDFRRRKEMQG